MTPQAGYRALVFTKEAAKLLTDLDCPQYEKKLKKVRKAPPETVEFVGSTYGGPIVMVTPSGIA